MTKKKRMVLLAVLGVGCVFVGSAVRSCILLGVNPAYCRVGSVLIPESQISVSLWAGSMRQTGFEPYDGAYRILEVVERDRPSAYYDLPSAYAMDQCDMDVFWYPTENALRLKDKGFDDAKGIRSECLVDLNQRAVFGVLRGSGVTHLVEISGAKGELAFPQSRYEVRVASSSFDTPSDLRPDSSATMEVDGRISRPTSAAWTTNSGVLVGVITGR